MGSTDATALFTLLTVVLILHRPAKISDPSSARPSFALPLATPSLTLSTLALDGTTAARAVGVVSQNPASAWVRWHVQGSRAERAREGQQGRAPQGGPCCMARWRLWRTLRSSASAASSSRAALPLSWRPASQPDRPRSARPMPAPSRGEDDGDYRQPQRSVAARRTDSPVRSMSSRPRSMSSRPSAMGSRTNEGTTTKANPRRCCLPPTPRRTPLHWRVRGPQTMWRNW